MSSQITSQTLQALFESGNYDALISQAKLHKLSVADNPYDSRFLAAAYFRLGRFPEAISILEDLSPVFGG